MTAILRVMGLSQEQQFQNYHRGRRSSRALSRILLRLLVTIFVLGDAPIVVGSMRTIEHQPGAEIAAKGIYRDPVWTSQAFFVKIRGLRSRVNDAVGSHFLVLASVGLALSDYFGTLGTVQ